MAKANKWKNRDGVVYSTNQRYQYEYGGAEEMETLPPSSQKLSIKLDQHKRAGKKVTLIEGFVGTTQDLGLLAKQLKTACGVGGSAKDGAIILQGDFREKASDFLSKEGYRVVRKG